MRVKKRNGAVVPFDKKYIFRAIGLAAAAAGEQDEREGEQSRQYRSFHKLPPVKWYDRRKPRLFNIQCSRLPQTASLSPFIAKPRRPALGRISLRDGKCFSLVNVM